MFTITPGARILFALGLVFLLLPVSQVLAADITVNSDCSLANAIKAANLDSNTHDTDCTAGSGADTITLTGDVALTASLPQINSTITIEGAGYTVDGGGANGLRIIQSRADSNGVGHVTINNLTVTGGNYWGSDGGGGASVRVLLSAAEGASPSLTITNSKIHGNEAVSVEGGGNGGGVNAGPNTTLTIRNSVISGNTAPNGSGGGIYFSGASATIANSAIYGNAVGNFLLGGGLSINGGVVTISNSTIHSNDSGGVFVGGTGTTTLTHVTIANQKNFLNNGEIVALASKVGLTRSGTGTLNLINSLIAGNLTGDCNIDGSFNQNVGNLIGRATTETFSCSTQTVALRGDPKLGALVASGAYYSLQSDSPAIDAADADYCLDKDQRGVDRGEDSCDIGAIEHLPPPVAKFTAIVDPGNTMRYSFDASSSTGVIDSYQWAFGDGATGSGQSASRTYAGGGNYRVTLTVANSDDRSSATREIPVLGKASRSRINVGEPPSEPAPIATPRPNTCLTLPASIRVSPATGGIQCQRVSGAAISDAAIRQAMTDAVDVWGWVRPNTQVCFAASGGTIKFIDTTPIPRVVYDLPAYRSGGMTCATIDRPGTVALLPGPPAPARYRSLSGCMVTTQSTLRFRDGPGGAPLQYTDPWGRQENGFLPPSVTLTALERTADWFKVDYYGTQGWVSAGHVTPQGNCG